MKQLFNSIQLDNTTEIKLIDKLKNKNEVVVECKVENGIWKDAETSMGVRRGRRRKWDTVLRDYDHSKK